MLRWGETGLYKAFAPRGPPADPSTNRRRGRRIPNRIADHLAPMIGQFLESDSPPPPPRRRQGRGRTTTIRTRPLALIARLRRMPGGEGEGEGEGEGDGVLSAVSFCAYAPTATSAMHAAGPCPGSVVGRGRRGEVGQPRAAAVGKALAKLPATPLSARQSDDAWLTGKLLEEAGGGMPKRTPKRASGQGRGGKKAQVPAEEYADEIDEFHAGRIPLEKPKRSLADSEYDDDVHDDEEGILDVEDDDDSDDDDDEDEDEELETLRKQKKYIDQKIAVEKGFEYDEPEADEDDVLDGATWGKRKQDYHGADNQDLELTDDEEAPREEEEEAKRLQKEHRAQMRLEDFGLDSDDDEAEEEEDEEDPTLAQRTKMTSTPKTSKKAKEALLEKVKKRDIQALTNDEKLAAVMKDAPELVALLNELKNALGEVDGKILPLLEKVRGGEVSTKEGISYLETKHLLMMTYCTNIVFYLLLKAEGVSVKDHPVLDRLVQLRLFMEKMRPIDKRLSYQVEKLLSSSVEPVGDEQNKQSLNYRPQPDKLVSKLGEDAGEEADDAVYRPPRLEAVTMDDETVKDRKLARQEAEQRRRASKTQVVQEMVREMNDIPEEVNDRLEPDAGWAARERDRLLKRAEIEEENFNRVQLTKAEKKRLRATERAGMQAENWDDFQDDVKELVAAAETIDRERKGRVASLVAEANKKSKKARLVSGDEELPLREDLGTRRARVAGRRAPDYEFEDDDKIDEGPVSMDDDETFINAVNRKHEKALLKAQRYGFEGTEKYVVSRVEDAEPEDGRRDIPRDIMKNRGLTPHHRKDLKNPRKHARVKHNKAVKRRKGQVQDIAGGTAGYGGEATGIKGNLSRSRRFADM
eukprot:scaffold6685_cov202-Prasinococcus_capsulatus_cf.AAC.12